MHDWLAAYVAAQHRVLDSVPLGAVAERDGTVRGAWAAGRAISVIGNGGNAAGALHFATDLGKGASDAAGRRFRVASLADNAAWLTALGNDDADADVIARQLENLAGPGDVPVAGSVSGDSPNLVKAFEWAAARGLRTVALVGAKRGRAGRTGRFVGVRESRRIVGERQLTIDDLRKTTRYDDAVATGCWFLDIHPPKTTTDKPFAGSGFQPAPYDISYKTLVPRGVSNLLVAGRCHSATMEAASSSRVTVTAMALGEAAGVAAAMAAKAKTDAAILSGVKVRETLAAQNGGPFTDA